MKQNWPKMDLKDFPDQIAVQTTATCLSSMFLYALNSSRRYGHSRESMRESLIRSIGFSWFHKSRCL